MGGEFMIVKNESGEFNTTLYLSDWRYSAAALGLYRYFEFKGIPYQVLSDGISYNRETAVGDDSQKDYLDFSENYFKDSMHHLVLKDLNKKEELSEDEIKLYNEKLKANTQLKKVFKSHKKFDENNRDAVSVLLEENRYSILQETFRNGKSTYANFANTGALFSPKLKICRLNGYYADLPKKSKSISYNWDYSTFISQDEPEFDFIPFAFSKTREAFFLNNSCSMEDLIAANKMLVDEMLTEEENKNNPRIALFITSSLVSEFAQNNIEIIVKNRSEDFFRTLYLRREASEIFYKLWERFYRENKKGYYFAVTTPLKLSRGNSRANEGGYIDLLKESTDAVINLVHHDELIELLLREKDFQGRSKQENTNQSSERLKFRIDELIRVNRMIYEKEYNMSEKQQNYYIMQAKDNAQKIVQSLKGSSPHNYESKLKSYRVKLTSCLTFKDYDRFNTILLQLSAYSAVQMQFAEPLFKDFEQNKNIAFTFVNNLAKITDSKKEEEDNIDE